VQQVQTQMTANEMAEDLYHKHIEPGMKRKDMEKLAIKCCEAADVFYTAMTNYANERRAQAGLAPVQEEDAA